MGKDSSNCLGCSKKFTKSDTSVQCTVCGLWSHTICANVSAEVFEMLDRQKRDTGITYWACRPCTTFAQGMNHRLRQIAEELKEVKENTKSNTEAINKLEKKVEEVAEIAKKADGMSRQEVEARLREERDEDRERRDRELNVIIHGADECGPETEGGEGRMQWDKEECLKLFNHVKVKVKADDVKFCRRVGPKGDRARPLIVGFYKHTVRNEILRADYRDMGPEISVGPDLTKKQREEEIRIWKEMEEKNNNRSADEKSKNLIWRLVGQKGERRLVLGQDRGQSSGAGRGASTRPAAKRPTFRQAEPRAARGRGAAAHPNQSRMSLLEPIVNDKPFRPRLSSKRKEREAAGDMEEEEEVEMMEPPTKH
jgi:hypothetical protein